MRDGGLRILAAVFALTWLVLPGFGLIDLMVTWSPDWPQVLEAGWGLYFTFLVGAPFVLIALRPERLLVASVQLAIAAAVLAVSVAAGDEPELVWVPVAVSIEIAILLVLGHGRPSGAGPLVPSPALMVVALVGAGPWSLYALRMYEANRGDRPDADITNGIDHYAVQGALGIAVAVLAFVAAVWPAGRRFIGTCVGVTAAYLGLVSYAWTGAAGGVDPRWSLASIAWGAGLVALAWRTPATSRVAVT